MAAAAEVIMGVAVVTAAVDTIGVADIVKEAGAIMAIIMGMEIGMAITGTAIITVMVMVIGEQAAYS